MAAAGGGEGGGGGGPKTVGDVIGETLLRTLEAAEEKLDDKLAKMERMDDDEYEKIRVRRREQMRKVAVEKAKWAAAGHGEYRECTDEKTFFAELKPEARAVVHFYRSSTRRCEIVDRHLGALARKHLETKFIRVDAERCLFLVERLKIWALPTIVLVKGGKTDHSIIGFDEMGGRDDFTTDTMEAVLLAHGVILESFAAATEDHDD